MNDTPKTNNWCALAVDADIGAVLELAKENERLWSKAVSVLKTLSNALAGASFKEIENIAKGPALAVIKEHESYTKGVQGAYEEKS